MGKVIIVKKEDGGIVRICPNLDKYGEGKKPFSECKGLKKYIEQGLGWFVCENDELPPKTSLEDRKQWYYDGNSVKADMTWERRLMPPQLIKKKHIKNLGKTIDDELVKETPDMMTIIKNQRQIECCKEIDDEIFWHEKALEGLARAEVDKTAIRLKLEEKIAKLKAK